MVSVARSSPIVHRYGYFSSFIYLFILILQCCTSEWCTHCKTVHSSSKWNKFLRTCAGEPIFTKTDATRKIADTGHRQAQFIIKDIGRKCSKGTKLEEELVLLAIASKYTCTCIIGTEQKWGAKINENCQKIPSPF